MKCLRCRFVYCTDQSNIVAFTYDSQVTVVATKPHGSILHFCHVNIDFTYLNWKKFGAPALSCSAEIKLHKARVGGHFHCVRHGHCARTEKCLFTPRK